MLKVDLTNGSLNRLMFEGHAVDITADVMTVVHEVHKALSLKSKFAGDAFRYAFEDAMKKDLLFSSKLEEDEDVEDEKKECEEKTLKELLKETEKLMELIYEIKKRSED